MRPNNIEPDYETLLDDDFSMFPFGWMWNGGGGPASEPNFGYPAPSGLVRGELSPVTTFTFTNQAIDVRVTSFLRQDTTFGEQYAVFKMSNDYTVSSTLEVAYVSYRLINNRQVNLPIMGYPAGQTAEVSCRFVGGTVSTMQVPYVEGSVYYELFITVDGNGGRCGFDETTMATSTDTSVTGVYRAVIGASGTAWFDNLIVRQAD